MQDAYWRRSNSVIVPSSYTLSAGSFYIDSVVGNFIQLVMVSGSEGFDAFGILGGINLRTCP